MSKLRETLNKLFLKLNRWQGSRAAELSQNKIDPLVYNHGRRPRVTGYIMGQERCDKLLEQIGNLNEIIKRAHNGPMQDRHMVQVWSIARKVLQTKLDELTQEDQAPMVDYNNSLSEIGHRIDFYKERIDRLTFDDPFYETFDKELKLLQKQWRALASRYNPSYD